MRSAIPAPNEYCGEAGERTNAAEAERRGTASVPLRDRAWLIHAWLIYIKSRSVASRHAYMKERPCKARVHRETENGGDHTCERENEPRFNRQW